MSDELLPFSEDQYGFTWGPAEVHRLASMNGQVCIGIKGADGHEVRVYVSAKGYSIRVFHGGGLEMK